MPEPAFDTLGAARGLESAGIDSGHAEALVDFMGQSADRPVTREHFGLTVEHFDQTVKRLGGKIAKLGTELRSPRGR